MTRRAIKITEPRSGLSATALLLPEKAPDNAAFLWAYLEEPRVVAGIPVIIWFGAQEYTAIMKLYQPREGYIVADDFELYWRLLLVYTSVVLWPLCATKIIVAIRISRQTPARRAKGAREKHPTCEHH